jgi:hypothetical protein
MNLFVKDMSAAHQLCFSERAVGVNDSEQNTFTLTLTLFEMADAFCSFLCESVVQRLTLVFLKYCVYFACVI